ncbi:MAG: hypothetical protein ACYC2E_03950 [Sulfuricella sp.]
MAVSPAARRRKSRYTVIFTGVEVVGMDNAALFGEVLYALPFGEAIARKLLTDYRVVIIPVLSLSKGAWTTPPSRSGSPTANWSPPARVLRQTANLSMVGWARFFRAHAVSRQSLHQLLRQIALVFGHAAQQRQQFLFLRLLPPHRINPAIPAVSLMPTARQKNDRSIVVLRSNLTKPQDQR